MGWLDDAGKWLDDRKKDAEALSNAVIQAPETAVKAAQNAIKGTQKTADEWGKELEDVVLKSGTMPYEQLPQPIKDLLDKLKKDSAALSTATQEIITGLQIPEIPEIPVPGDLFGAAKQILNIIRIPGHIFLNWMKITETIYQDNDSLLKEMERLGKR